MKISRYLPTNFHQSSWSSIPWHIKTGWTHSTVISPTANAVSTTLLPLFRLQFFFGRYEPATCLNHLSQFIPFNGLSILSASWWPSEFTQSFMTISFPKCKNKYSKRNSSYSDAHSLLTCKLYAFFLILHTCACQDRLNTFRSSQLDSHRSPHTVESPFLCVSQCDISLCTS